MYWISSAPCWRAVLLDQIFDGHLKILRCNPNSNFHSSAVPIAQGVSSADSR